jgi:hypothetical protein
MTFPLLNLLGVLAGVALCYLPYRLFLRHERRLTEEEWCAEFPRRAWVVKAAPGIGLLVFLSFIPVFATTDVGKQINWFFLPCVFCLWMFALSGVLEVGTRTSFAMWSRGRDRALFVQGPNARPAGVLRLALTALVLALFFAYR